MRASDERHNLQNKIKRWEEQMSGRGRGSKTTGASTISSLKIEGTSVPLSSVPTEGCWVQLAEEDSRALREIKNIAEGRLQDYKSRLEGAKKQVEDQVKELHRAEGAQSSNTLAIKLQTEIDCMQDPVAQQRLVDLIGQFSNNQESKKRGICMRRTRSSVFLDEGLVGSLAQPYPVKNPRGGATAFSGGYRPKKNVDHAKLKKGTLSTPTTVESGIDAIVDAMVVDACTDTIADATIVDATVVDACTNDIVDAMEVDASTDAAADGNVNDGGTESIVRAIIDTILDVVEAMGTNAIVVSGTDAIVDDMVVDACTDAIVDATVVDACTNDIVDAMEVDASSDATAHGNVNDGGTESIVHAVINALLDVVEAMVGASDVTTQAELVCPSDATVEDTIGMGEEVLVEREARTHEAMGASDVTTQAEEVCPSDAADDIVDAEEAKGTDAAVEDMRGLGEEDLTKTIPRIGSAVGTGDVTASIDIAEAGDRAIQLGEAMREAIVATTNMKEANTRISTKACIEQNNVAGKGTEVPTDRAAQLGEAMGENTNEAGTKNANKEAKKGHELKGQERVKCLVVMPLQIVALPPTSCEEKTRRDNLCIILDKNGLLLRRYKVSYYKGIARSSTLDLARSKYQVVTGPNVQGKMQFEYVVRPNASTFLDALLTRAQVVLWRCVTQDNLQFALSACFPELNKQLFLDIIGQEGCREASFKLNQVPGIPRSRDNAKPIFFKCLNDFWKHYTKFNFDNTLVVDDTLYKCLLNPPGTWVCPDSFDPTDILAHGQGKSIEASSQRSPRQPTAQSPLARPPTQRLTRLPTSKAPLKQPPTEPANKERKNRGQRKSESSEGDENIEEDPDDEEVDDVLDIDSLPIENLDREDEPLGDLLDPLPTIDIAA
ncbi:hypothetical protein L7F22_021730 [Adiantum nelumboides]|nr:hypothetical protein [Adiantum nelumboides]